MKSIKYIKYIKRKTKTKHSNKGKRTRNHKKTRNKKYKGGASTAISFLTKAKDMSSKLKENPLDKAKDMASKLKENPLDKVKDLSGVSGKLDAITGQGKDAVSKAISGGLTGAAFGPLGGIAAKYGTGAAKNIKTANLKDMTPGKLQIIPTNFFSTIMKSMVGIGKAILLMPTLAMNQIVPPHLCKYYLKNSLCGLTTLEYFVKGSRPDYLKREIENDKCIEFNPETNKYEQCKPTRFKDDPKDEGKIRGGAKELILKCKEKINHGLNKGDRVIVFYPIDIPGNKLQEDVYIGKILSIEGEKNEIINIKIENGDIIHVLYDEININIMIYNKNFETFMIEFKKYYIKNIKLSDETSEFIEWSIVMSFYLLLKGLQKTTLMSIFVALGVPTAALVGSAGVVAGAVVVGSMPIVLTIVGIFWIYKKVSTNKSLQKIYLAQIKKIINDESIKLEKRNKYILQQLVKINHQLKMYECPRTKLESIFENINSVELLKNIYNIIVDLIEDKDYYDQKTCDLKYEELREPGGGAESLKVPFFDSKTAKLITKFDLKPDIEHVDAKNHILQFIKFPIDTFHTPPCKSCNDINRFDPLKILDSFNKIIKGNKDNITYIIIHIFKDIVKGNSDNETSIQKYTRSILQNIQCRSDILGVIAERIEKLSS